MAGRKDTSEWVLTRLSMPPTWTAPQSFALLVLMLVGIGVADSLSGLRISLAVFYLVPILLSTAWFDSKVASGLAISSVCIRVLGDFIANDEHSLPLWSWWNSASQLLVFLFVVWVFSNLIGIYRQVAQRVSERTAELMESVAHRRLLEHELINVSANERNSMGQELHDDICQHLVGTTLAAQVLAQRLEQQQSALAAEARGIIGLIEEGTGKTRQLARGLLLSAIEPGQFAEKLGELADEGSRSGVPCSFRQAGQVQVADAGTAAQLYRIAQEAMRNAVRHASASRVEISLVGDRDAVCLMVEDDGRGLPGDEPRSGMGLPIMSHRAAYIGATLKVMSSDGQGTRVVCHLPTRPEPMLDRAGVMSPSPSQRIRVFLVDDHPLVRDWLKNLLQMEPDFEVTGEADDGPSALAAMTGAPPDVAVVDLSLKRGSGLDIIKSMRIRLPDVRVLVLSMHEEISDVERALRAGARGYVMKGESSSQIVPAIRWVHAGKVYATPEVFSRLAERMTGTPLANADQPADVLSDREMHVFRRIGEGFTTRRIADELRVSQKTIQTYCARIKEKIGLDDGAELALTAIRWRETNRF